MSVTQSIVQNHGGDITVRNAEGGGAIFTLEIPVYQTVSSEYTIVLVCEDELIRYPVERMLQKAGLQLKSFSKIEHAFSSCSYAQPQIAILTTLTPQIYARIKLLWPKVKVFYIQDSDETISLADVNCIYKPVNYAHLVEALKINLQL